MVVGEVGLDAGRLFRPSDPEAPSRKDRRCECLDVLFELTQSSEECQHDVGGLVQGLIGADPVWKLELEAVRRVEKQNQGPALDAELGR